MNQNRFAKGLMGLMICAMCLSYGGCTGEAQTPEANEQSNSVPQVKPTKAEPSPDPVAAAKKAAQEDLPFTVRISAQPAEAGKNTQAIIKATPASGFKMNVDFPSSFVPDVGDGTKFAKAKLSFADAQIAEEAIAFSPDYTVAKAGSTQLTGKISISVCNEKVCKLYRNHPIAWSVDAK